jgi:hypothetical protein
MVIKEKTGPTYEYFNSKAGQEGEKLLELAKKYNK